jgi:recombinational DNA repair protein RecT
VPGHGVGLLDIKTTRSGIFGEVGLQLAAYRNAEFYIDADGKEQPMPRTTWAGAIWVRADGYDLVPVESGPDVYRVFRYAQQIAQFQMGYRGVAKLVRRSDQVRDISPAVVYANDEFNVLLGTDQRIVHRPYYMLGHNAPGAVIAAYTVVTFKDGATSFRVVPRYDLDRAAEASGNPGNKEWSNVWNKHFDAMSMKTALLRHAKWLPMPDDCLRAVNVDERREMGVPEDVNEFIDAEVTDQRDDGYDDNGDDAPTDPLNTLADDR